MNQSSSLVSWFINLSPEVNVQSINISYATIIVTSLQCDVMWLENKLIN